MAIVGTTADNALTGTSGADLIQGLAGSDTLNGAGGNDTLDGGTGNDIMIGGDGNDFYVVDSTTDLVTEVSGGGTDTVSSSVTWTMAGNVENLVLTGVGNIDATGNALGNNITGNAGANVISGGGGADTMAGGAGNDTYVVDHTGDVVTEAAGAGTDRVTSSVSFTLGNNLENLVLTGGTNNLTGTGNTLANSITGNSGNNTLDGGTGADTLIGGVGNDVYIIDNSNDIITEATGEGTDIATASASFTLGNFVENLVLSGSGNINGGGNTGDNEITGNSGNNVLSGQGGTDTLVGGLGNDTYVIDGSEDTITENAGEGTDTVVANYTYTLSNVLENITLSGSTAIDAYGNTAGNSLTGNLAANLLDGDAGADTMAGGAGNDTYIVDNTGDTVTEAAAAGTDTVSASVTFTLGANVENLVLTGTDDLNGTGNTSANSLTGNSGANVLSGGAGNDTMIGGAGNDSYIVDASGDVVTEATGEGTDTVSASVSYTLGNFVENLVLTGTGAINGTGNTLDNSITGNSGANVLNGGAGADTMTGGLGNDTYVVDATDDSLVENASEGTDTVQSSITFTLANHFENLTLTGADNLNAVGNTVNNVLTGNSGANLLDGDAGADTMAGGAGNDNYIVDNTGDTVTEAAAAGTDTVSSSVTFTLGANVENLVLTGTDDLNGTGNTSANSLTGNSGANVLSGGAGNDTMIGGAGNDSYIVDATGDVVTEAASEGTDTVSASASFTLGANVENLVLTGTGAINGTGNTLDNSITGNSGANVLDGGGGADTLIGGAGNDNYIVDSTDDVVTEAAGAGSDRVSTDLNYTLGDNLELLVLTGTADINGTGNTLANNMAGNTGNNVMDGGVGADTMAGGAGNDSYIVDNTGDVVSEQANRGTDTVSASVTYTLSADVENLVLTGTDNLNGTGNTSANTLTGNSGANVLSGGAGNDTMIGGDGNDSYVVDATGDTITELTGEGTDTVSASVNYTLGNFVENLVLTGTGAINGTGNTLDNSITGNSAANVLDGGGGADTLVGGAGNDSYVVDSTDDVVTEAANGGTDTVSTELAYTLGDNLENLVLTGTAALGLTGNTLANRLTGNSASNTLDGGAGADTLVGGDGNDIYIIDHSGDTLTELANQGTDVATASVSFSLGTNFVEDLVLSGTADISGTGNTLANTLTGNSGANILDGGAGADTLVGGAGNDSYIVDNTGDTITEVTGEGTDTVSSSIAYTLGNFVENLTLTGTASVSGTGNTLDNNIRGNSGANVLDGGGGADTLIGGAGNDNYIVDSTDDVVTEAAGGGSDRVSTDLNYTLGDNLELLVLTGTADVNATGNTLANNMAGNTGNNVMDGGVGADTMAGGGGNDSYIVDNTGDVVSELANRGTDTVSASVTYTLSSDVENLVLTGTGNINATGNTMDNALTGNSGNNVLNGGVGADAMTGGAGNDTYVVDNTGDTVTEVTGEGTDTVSSSISYTLGDFVENLILFGTSAINGTGNTLDNSLTGNSGANVLDGGGGADTLIGGAGNDSYVVDSTDDVVTEAAASGTDTVSTSLDYTLGANLENLVVTGTTAINVFGNTLANQLRGNTADNLIDGGAGADAMIGGAGNDNYVVDHTGDTVTEVTGEGTDTVSADVSFVLGNFVENLVLTGTGAINATGNTDNNSLTGNSGNNVLSGGAGDDTMIGGAGNDTYVVDSTGDTVTEVTGEGTDTVSSSIAYTLGNFVENLVLSGTGAISGTGNTLANSLTGNSGANVLDGDAGADTMAGGAGNDTYIVDNTGDTVTEAAAAGTDTVSSSVTFTLGANVENLVLTGTDDLNGTGNTSANSLTGNSGANVLDGGTGADALIGGAGNDSYIVDNTGDTVTELTGEGTDTVSASASFTLGNFVENLVLTGTGNISGAGNSLDNSITGNSGNNVLNGGLGADTLTGGLGNDTYVVDATDDSLVENASEGTDTVQSSITFTLANHFENLTLTGSSDINAVGNTVANTLTGNSGANLLDGDVGADTMAGGAGNDTYIVDNTGDTVTEAAAAGTDTVSSSVTFTLGANVENLVLTGTDDLNGTGNTSANSLTGNSGANVLDGGAGNDTMIGGAGNDSYIVDATGDVVTEAASEGTDTVSASASFTLGANVENLVLTGTAAINGTGNTLDNSITGNSGANVLSGGGGADTLVGGAGNDNYIVDSTDDVVTETANNGSDRVSSSISYTLGDHLELLTLTGSDDLNGVGNTLANNMAGNNGNNLLDGGVGADTMAGGAGNDNYIVDNTGDVVSEQANRGTDTVSASVTYTLSADVENLVLTGTDDLNGTGNTLANTLTGNSGANVLSGGVGADTLIGGAGNDSYIVDNTGDVVTEATGEGTDTVSASASFTLGNFVENLVLTGTAAISGTGNTLDNSITGNSGANVLNGGGGADTLIGGAGNDSYVVDSTDDVVTEAANGGTDTVSTELAYTLGDHLENLVLTGTAALGLTGNTLANSLTGNSGDNTLDGGVGADTMAGGAGNDSYLVDNTADVITEAASAGTDVASASVSYTLGNFVENLVLTGTADLNGTGNTGNNSLTGNSGVNVLSGGLGNDTMIGGAGNDSYIVDATGDVVTEVTGEGTDTVSSSISYTLADFVENLVLTGTGAINGTGNTLDNNITGNSAANVLNGGGGADTLVGGAGNDSYVVDSTDDVVTEAANGGTDTVSTELAYTLGDHLENLVLTGTDSLGLTGNTLANSLTGNAGDNTLDGGVGADTMAGGAGNDTYIVDNTADVITEAASAGTDVASASVSYTLSSNVENLVLTGTADLNGTGNTLANSLTGNSGANVLNGGLGNDTMIGGAGNDSYIVDNTGDTVTEVTGEGTDVVSSSISYTLADFVENLVLTGTGAINGTGNTLDNSLTGNSGANVLSGGGGADTLVGGAGNDSYVVDSTDDVVTEAANGGTDTVSTELAYTLGDHLENLVLTGTDSLGLTGNTLANSLTGNSGDNTLDGGVGADTLAGGAGNDNYIIDSTADVITEAASAGTDVASASVTYTLASNVENLVLTGTGNINGTGNTLDNSLTGNSGDNVLSGGAGNDTMVGGAGNDTYVVDSTGDTVTEATGEGTDTVSSSINYTLGDFVENLTLYGAAAASATGNTLDNVLTGNSAANVLSGGGGADTMVGGAGNDSYVVDSTDDVVTEAANGGTDTVSTELAYTLGNFVENLVLTGTANLDGTGNTLANSLTGNSGNNVLDGGTGADAMAGGDGNDSYIVDHTGDTVTEAASAGTDTVSAGVTFTLSANIETLTLTGTSDIDATGNTSDNTLNGNSGNNILNGGNGDDTLVGNTGNDILIGGNGSDRYTFDDTDGNDVIIDNSGSDDRVVFGSDVSDAEVAFFMDGTDLTLGITGGGTILISGFGAGGEIERIELSDGQYFDVAEINQLIADIATTAANNSISLTSVSDVLGSTTLMNLITAAWD